uniref:glutathione transferase n=1 Tax=Panagrolaimus superbus TaxID=310955 RepID=A0A914ZBB1_9BILA
MVAYKLTYFDLRGIAEAIRLMFHYLEVPFEDIRIDSTNPEVWEKCKPTTPQGKLPLLEVDGVIIPQSYAIARFIARKYNLAGKDDLEAAQVDALADFLRDMQYEHFSPYMFVVQGYDEGDKDKLREEIFLPAVKQNFTYLVKTLKNSNSGFFMPSGITWVDFVISQYLNLVRRYDKECFEDYPELIEHLERIHSFPQLKIYLEKRKNVLFHIGEKS